MVSEGPGAAWSPAPMGSVDRWPLASLDTQSPGGSRPAVAAVRRRDRGVRTPHPRPVCRSPSAPSRASWRDSLRADRCLGSFQWGQLDGRLVPPVRRGSRGGRASLWRPFQMEACFEHAGLPSGRPVGPGRARPPLRRAAASSRVRHDLGIWLILPVVICLSQRLSHACLSLSD